MKLSIIPSLLATVTFLNLVHSFSYTNSSNLVTTLTPTISIYKDFITNTQELIESTSTITITTTITLDKTYDVMPLSTADKSSMQVDGSTHTQNSEKFDTNVQTETQKQSETSIQTSSFNSLPTLDGINNLKLKFASENILSTITKTMQTAIVVTNTKNSQQSEFTTFSNIEKQIILAKAYGCSAETVTITHYSDTKYITVTASTPTLTYTHQSFAYYGNSTITK